MSEPGKILAVIDANVDGVAARAALTKMCQSGKLVIAKAPDVMDGLLQTESWSAVLHCGEHDSETIEQIDQLRPDLAIITLDISSNTRPSRPAFDTEPYRDLSPGTVVWSAIAVAVGVSVGSWFLVSNLVGPSYVSPDELFANEKVEELLDFSTASGQEEPD
jgi:hypothetical protein